jgi:hypothetical protein
LISASTAPLESPVITAMSSTEQRALSASILSTFVFIAFSPFLFYVESDRAKTMSAVPH